MPQHHSFLLTCWDHGHQLPQGCHRDRDHQHPRGGCTRDTGWGFGTFYSVLPSGHQQAVSLALSIASSSPQDQKATSEVPSHLLLPRISCPTAATTFQQSKRARTPGKKRGTLQLSASTLQHTEPPLQTTRTLPPGSPGARAGRTRDKALQRALRASRKAFSSPVPSEPGQSRCSRGVQPAAHRDGGRRLPELALS